MDFHCNFSVWRFYTSGWSRLVEVQKVLYEAKVFVQRKMNVFSLVIMVSYKVVLKKIQVYNIILLVFLKAVHLSRNMFEQFLRLKQSGGVIV